MSSPAHKRLSGNRFFDPPGETAMDFPRKGKLYAAIESEEDDEKNGGKGGPWYDEPLYFECFDAAWVGARDVNVVYAGRIDDFYDDIPLRVVELKDRALMATYPFTATPGAIIWFVMEYVVVGENDANALLYSGLFADGVPVRLDNLFAISKGDIYFAHDSRSVLPDVSGSGSLELTAFLNEMSAIRCSGVAVYDVGQGACQAVLQDGNTAHPALYVDFGGGVLGNKKTFPSEFTHACFSAAPAIVLSHWDWDHWSFAPRVFDALGANWFVPPIPDKPVQKTFAAKLKKNGRLHIWDVAPGTTLQMGDVELGRCYGRTTNDSGIAVLVTMRDNSGLKKCLLPGDVDYRYLPGAFVAQQTWALVISHHGGKLKSSAMPTPAHDSVTVCSAGSGNTYKHPFVATFNAHTSAGWGWPVSIGLCYPRPSHAVISPQFGVRMQLGRCHRHGGEQCRTSFSI